MRSAVTPVVFAHARKRVDWLSEREKCLLLVRQNLAVQQGTLQWREIEEELQWQAFVSKNVQASLHCLYASLFPKFATNLLTCVKIYINVIL